MKLELGAGYQRTPGFTTVDINPNCDPDICSDVRAIPLPDASVSEIRAVDVWEHLPYRSTLPALQEWARLLEPGGRIYLQVPAADRAIAMVDDDRWQRRWAKRMPADVPRFSMISALAWVLLGGQDDGDMAREGDDPCWNLHMALFDELSIRECCKRAGLTIDSLETNEHPNHLTWAHKPCPM